MQTRSMARKAALARSASLDAPPPRTSTRDTRDSSPARSPQVDSTSTVLEVVSSDSAIIEHAPAEDAVTRNQHARAQQHMLHMMQVVHAESSRNTEARISQAVAATEARLEQTAQALVQAHAHEYALETRRDLGEAIQVALIDAHNQAHQQAMEAAHDRLSQFTAEINTKIQDQLTQAVNEVGTKGVAYIEGVTADSLKELRATAQRDIADGIQHAMLKYRSSDMQLVVQPTRHPAEDASSLQQQIRQLRADLQVQLEASEKRCYTEAVSTASVQAERLVSQAESRLVDKIEDRLGSVERRAKDMVTDAVVRAETHCNVVEKRAKESIERAVQDLHAAHRSMPSDRREENSFAIDQNLDRRMHDLMSTLLPKMEQIAAVAVQSRLSEQIGGKLEAIIAQQIETKLHARVHTAVAAALLEIDQQLGIKMQPHVRAIVDQVTPACVDQHLTAKLQLRVRSAVAQEAPALVDKLIASKLPPRVRAVVPEHVDDYLATKLQPRVRALVAAATVDHIEDNLSPKLQARLRELTVETIQEQVDAKFASRAQPLSAEAASQLIIQQYDLVIQPRVDRSIAEATSRLEQQLDRQQRHGGCAHPAPQPVYLASPAMFANLTPSVVSRSDTTTRPTDEPSDDLVSINQSLKQTYSRGGTSNQVQHDLDGDASFAKSARALLAARQQAKENTQARPVTRGRSIDCPVMLESIRSEALQRFVAEFQRYRDQGGAESWTAFASPAILGYLRSIECPEGFSDQKIFAHLQQKVDSARNDVTVLERKFREVKVDPKAKTSREKAESILVGVESVLLETNPNVPVATLINIVLEKLPRDLQTAIQRQMKFMTPVQTKRDFAKLLMEEATHFKWPATANNYLKREEN